MISKILLPPTELSQRRMNYEFVSRKEKEKIKTRKEAALLKRLRSGHCKLLAAYQHRLDESKDEKCLRCQERQKQYNTRAIVPGKNDKSSETTMSLWE